MAPDNDFLTELIPIVPVLIVVLSACAVLLAEAFRKPGEQMPVAVLGIIGLVGGIITSVMTRSGVLSTARSSPSWPSAAVTIS